MNAPLCFQCRRQTSSAINVAESLSKSATSCRATRPQRRGFSLIELIVAMTVLTVLMTSITVVLRTSRAAWESHQSDLISTQTAHSVVRHIARELREGDSVVSVSASSAPAGDLTIRNSGGIQLRWQHNATTKQVLFTDTSISGTAQVLAENVNLLKFSAYQPDGTTLTTSIEQMQSVRVDVTVPVPSTGGTRTIGSWIWLRNFGRNQAE